MRFAEAYLTKQWARKIFEDFLKVEIAFNPKGQTELTRILRDYPLEKANAIIEREVWS